MFMFISIPLMNDVKLQRPGESKFSNCLLIIVIIDVMLTSANGDIFRVTGPLCGEFIGHRWIPVRKAYDADLLCFLWSAPEETVE